VSECSDKPRERERERESERERARERDRETERETVLSKPKRTGNYLVIFDYLVINNTVSGSQQIF
jgi:hypothetical protein